MENKLIAFIITHGRPDNCITYNTLKKCGYTEDIHFIIDNEDSEVYKYIENYGADKVHIFDKKLYADNIDEANNFDNRKVIVHGRNACFDIAYKLGITYFIQLDDDYTSFDYRLIIEDVAIFKQIKNLDAVFNLLLKYYISANFTTIAMAQGGDFIGGIDNGKNTYRFAKRKAMNSFICSVNRPFQFIGSINEDVNTYTTQGGRGMLFLTVPFASLTQKQTQSQKGGMTGTYLSNGTYVKSFTTVLMQPGNVKVTMMQSNNPRLHHSIKWVNTVPMIISDKHKK